MNRGRPSETIDLARNEIDENFPANWNPGNETETFSHWLITLTTSQPELISSQTLPIIWAKRVFGSFGESTFARENSFYPGNNSLPEKLSLAFALIAFSPFDSELSHWIMTIPGLITFVSLQLKPMKSIFSLPRR